MGTLDSAVSARSVPTPHQLSQPLLHRHLHTGHSLRAGISHEQGVLMSMAGAAVDLVLNLSHGLGAV